MSFKLLFTVYDASVKVPTGIEYGVVYQFGNYDQCMNLKAVKSIDDVDISPMYCLADVIVDGFNVRSLASRKYEVSTITLRYIFILFLYIYIVD